MVICLRDAWRGVIVCVSLCCVVGLCVRPVALGCVFLCCEVHRLYVCGLTVVGCGWVE
jgi:hypothetical protein